ncbi:right-handed parallel beta-helix repeat-containing protein [Edwardsiella piscicida]|uniref:right-handed parallel beta-helix repeat-containing protein n=1 Tax=Edwardsiella piscicida TaxID=1263550 RepID=UPI000D513EED|nr:right-handed parallel beta-helix repeat-containing protein [Edwardsiella piscicida]EKS7814792.1 right-handed parallel beta-helix repeat-containing protein [Edwardsiella piscicida]UCQ20711.1 right-handed parallel beta-helix repeat-containing protein [Edwardsiella piscicida]
MIVFLKKDFGATGNAVDDDTSSVHKFFNYLSTHGGIGVIEAGTYNTSAYKFNHDTKPLSILGEGPTQCLFKNLSHGTFLTFDRCSGVKISGLTLDCQYTKTKVRMHGIALNTCMDSTIDNCHVYDYLGTGIIAYGSNTADGKKCSGIHVRDCLVQAEAAFKDWQNEPPESKKDKECNGVVLSDCENSKISGCRAVDISLFGIELKGHSIWNFVVNCAAKNCRYGFGMGQQTIDDTGCENNIVSDFLAQGCYMGGIVGKAKRNNMANFTVDFTGVPSNLAQNAFRFQLKSVFNSLDNLVVSGAANGIGMIRYESGASNNTAKITNCQPLSDELALVVAEYCDESQKTEGNYTVLLRSHVDSPHLTVVGDAASMNKTWYAWDHTEICRLGLLNDTVAD